MILLSLCLFLMVFLAISDCFGVLLIHVFIVMITFSIQIMFIV